MESNFTTRISGKGGARASWNQRPWGSTVRRTAGVFFALPLSALGSELIRAAVADDQQSVTLASPSGLIVEGDRSGRVEKKMTVSPASVGARPVRVRSTQEFIGVNGKSYRGWIEIRKKKNGTLLLINELDIEEYLM